MQLTLGMCFLLLLSQPTQPVFWKCLSGAGVGNSFPAYAVGGLTVHTPGERDENEHQPFAEIAHSTLPKLACGQSPPMNTLQVLPAWITFQAR